MTFEFISLGDILTLERRKAVVEPDKQYPEVGVYCFGRGLFHKEPRSGLEVGNKHLFKIKADDFILQVTFAWEGAVALATEKDEGFYGSVRVLTFRVEENRCLPDFLVNYFKTPEGVEQLGRISPGSAGRNRVLSKKRIPEVKVPLPPVSDQRRIVAKIERLAAKIEEAKRLRKKSSQIAHLLPDTQLETILTAHENDDSWDKCALPIVADVNPRRPQLDLKPDDMVSFVPMAAVDAVTGTIAAPQNRPLCEVRKGYTFFQEGDVLFARITPCMQNGKSAIATKLTNAIGFGTTEFHVLRPGKRIDGRFLHRIVRSFSFRKDAERHFKGTAGQQRVPAVFLNNKVIPVPPIEEQRQIVEHLEGLQARTDRLKALQAQTAAELDALLPSVLDRAFKGKL
ncbi:MAG: restriction endonuclease subunit S [Deltaproteobacteria bacterium]|nr:restriction endonuclease subunit S [Deltaproteobacteria bacterium]